MRRRERNMQIEIRDDTLNRLKKLVRARESKQPPSLLPLPLDRPACVADVIDAVVRTAIAKEEHNDHVGEMKKKGMSARLETLEKVKRVINGAYHDRDDYPPYKLASFEDRAIYHQYILKLIYELIDFEKGKIMNLEVNE